MSADQDVPDYRGMARDEEQKLRDRVTVLERENATLLAAQEMLTRKVLRLEGHNENLAQRLAAVRLAAG